MGRRMKRSRALALGALAATVLACSAPPAQAARPLHTGLFDLDAYIGGGPLAFKRTRAAGADFIRLVVSWRRVAPSGLLLVPPLFFDPTDPAARGYDWGRYDRQVRMATRAGLTILGLVTDAPVWAEGHCGDRRGICNPNPKALGAFATAAALRYSGHFDPDGAGPEPPLPEVRFWQGLNEPNLYFFFNPQRDGSDVPVSPYLYRELINRFTEGIRSGNPAARVLAAGLAPLGIHPAVAPLEFMRRLLCMRGRRRPRPACNARVSFDIWAMHPYTSGGPTHHARGPDEVSLADLPKMRRLLAAAARAGHIDSRYRRVPFWVTEFSWDTKPPDCGGLRPRLAARWLSHAFYVMWQNGIDHVFWFLLRDQPSGADPDSVALQSGLYLRARSIAADRPKLILSAFRFPFVAERTRSRVRLWGRTPNSGAGPVRIEVRIRGRWRKLRLLQADRLGVFLGNAAMPGAWRRSDPRWAERPVRAVFGHDTSVPFSLRTVPDRFLPAFGGC